MEDVARAAGAAEGLAAAAGRDQFGTRPRPAGQALHQGHLLAAPAGRVREGQGALHRLHHPHFAAAGQGRVAEV